MLEALEKLNAPERPFTFSDLPQRMQATLEFGLTSQKDFPDELKRCFDVEDVSKLIRFTGSRDNEMKVSLTVGDKEHKFWDFEVCASGAADQTITGCINSDMILLDAKSKTKFCPVPDVEHLFQTLRTERWREDNSYYLPAVRSGLMQSHGVIMPVLIKQATRLV